MNREEVYAKCDELGMGGVLAQLEAAEWNEARKRFAREWVRIKDDENAQEAIAVQEDQHEEQIETLNETTTKLVEQMSASATGIQDRMDRLGEKVETLDERLEDLNTTIDNASNSSGRVAWALWGLTLMITVVAVIGLLIELKIISSH